MACRFCGNELDKCLSADEPSMCDGPSLGRIVDGLRKSQSQCRCRDRQVWPTQVACHEHWNMLPAPIRNSLAITYREGLMDSYNAILSVCDQFWALKGVTTKGQQQ
jgi:hypothetical protein